MYERSDKAAGRKNGLLSLLGHFLLVLRPSLHLQQSRLTLALLLSVVSILFGLLGPVSIQWIIDIALPQKDMGKFIRYAGIAVLSFILAHAVWAVHLGLGRHACEDVIRDFKNRIVQSVLRKQQGFFHEYKSGDVLTRMVADIEVVSQALYKELLLGLGLALYCLVIFVFMLYWDWRLSLLLMACLPIYLSIAIALDAPLTRLTQRARNCLSAQSDDFLDILQGRQDIRANQRQKAYGRQFEQAAANVARANARAGIFAAMALNATSLVGMIISILPFLAGGYLLLRGTDGLTVGSLVSMYMLMALVSRNLLDLFENVSNIVQARPALVRLEEILDYPEAPEPAALALESVPERMGVVFSDVHFAYPGREPILRGMDLRIDEGERIALLGASGSGKSTLAALMMRSIVPAKGRILQEGVPIAHIPLGLYLSQIGYVGQEAHLFRSTVEENLRLSWPAATESHLWSTLEVVGMRDVIEQLPQGLKTPLGAGGAALSGGQKQRLCLARALLRDPRLLILDEFTSALDRPTENAILDQLLEHGPSVGILCITHSPNVAGRFTRKLELHEGLLRPMESALQAT